MTTTVSSEQFIKTTPAQVYYALMHATALHEWLCDFATVAPRPEGGCYAAGLCKDDVIIELDGKSIPNDYAVLLLHCLVR